MAEVSTSILNVEKDIAVKTFYNLEAANTDYFHIDVMDGKFVANNTVKLMLEYSNYIKQISNLPLDVHLMVEDVKKYIDDYLVLEPNIITFHIEAMQNKEKAMEIIQYIKNNNIKVGMSIKPNTELSAIIPYLEFIHMILVMTVEPGLRRTKTDTGNSK